jgi:KaiC/GvpD/RAD55 family RecA-like ATPase
MTISTATIPSDIINSVYTSPSEELEQFARQAAELYTIPIQPIEKKKKIFIDLFLEERKKSSSK